MTTKRFTLEDIEHEAAISRSAWGSYRSEHEAYGVLAEEMAELLDAIRNNNAYEVHYEAMQVAAVAYRLASEAWDRRG